MKIKMTLIVGILCLIVLTLFCYNTEKFMIGAYVNNKNTDFWHDLHEPIAQLMQAGGFNACISTAAYDPDSASVGEMLRHMADYNLDGILEDCIIDPVTSAYGARTLSMGNYFKFEAEYCNSDVVSGNDSDYPDSYFYMSPNANSARIGSHNNNSTNGFSNGYYWQVNNGQAGYAFRDLTYKWTDRGTNRYRRVGQEFRFPFNGPLNDSNGDPDYSLFNTNELYVTFALQCTGIESLPNSTILAAIEFNSRGPNTDSTAYVDIPHYSTTADSLQVSYITKEQYESSPENTDPYIDMHYITVSIPLKTLKWRGALMGNTYWNKSLVNLNPNLIWYGHGTLKLDYIEYKDRLYRDFTDNVDRLAQIRKFESYELPFLYGYDEPAQGQFDSFNIISSYLHTDPTNPTLIAAIHNFNGEVLKTNNEAYQHRKAYYDTVQPQVMAVDEYPFTHNVSPDWTNPNAVLNGDSVFVQRYIGKVCSEYNKIRPRRK